MMEIRQGLSKMNIIAADINYYLGGNRQQAMARFLESCCLLLLFLVGYCCLF